MIMPIVRMVMNMRTIYPHKDYPNTLQKLF